MFRERVKSFGKQQHTILSINSKKNLTLKLSKNPNRQVKDHCSFAFSEYSSSLANNDFFKNNFHIDKSHFQTSFSKQIFAFSDT